MGKLLGWTVVLAGAAYAAWWYWQSSNEANTEAWASATDRIR